MTIKQNAMIRFARLIGATCVAVTALVLVTASPSLATAPSSSPQSSSPLLLNPSAQSAPKPAAAVKVRQPRTLFQRNPSRAPATGNADLAFLSAGQFVELAADYAVTAIVAENEFSPLDFSAGLVRVVDPDELSEIDLANDPDVLLAQNPLNQDAGPIVQVAATPARTDDSDDDDGVLNRILMTFAGALAMASAMRMIIA